MTQVSDVTLGTRNIKLPLKQTPEEEKHQPSTLNGDIPNNSGFFLLFFPTSFAYFPLLINLRPVSIRPSSRWPYCLLLKVNRSHQTETSLTLCYEKDKSPYLYIFCPLSCCYIEKGEPLLYPRLIPPAVYGSITLVFPGTLLYGFRYLSPILKFPFHLILNP